MKKTIQTFALLFIVSTSFGQAAGNSVYSRSLQRGNAYGGSENIGYNSNEVNLQLNNNSYSFSIMLEASTMMNVRASAFTAIFSLTQNAATVEEAELLLRNRIEIFTRSLASQNIAQDEVFVDPISMVPTYEIEVTQKKFSKTMNEIPSGFEIKKNVHITVHKQSQLNDIITVAARAEVYDLVKVDYTIENLGATLQTLRQEALKILLAKKLVIETAGINIRFTNLGEMHGSAFPAERYAQYYAYKTGVAPAFTASYKKNQQPQTVTYNYAEKNKTIYYDKVSDKQFDMELNPIVTEPVVQVYFSLKAEYTTYNPQDELINKMHNNKMVTLQEKEVELRLEAMKKDIDLKGKIPMVKEKIGPKQDYNK